MSDPKILFTDLDDTLFNAAKEITAENQMAIDQALREGHHIVLTTGRSLPGLLPTIQKTGLNREGCYAIAYNGAVIYDCCRGETIYECGIPLEDVRYIFQKARQFGLHCQTYDRQWLLAARDCPELQDYVRRTGVAYRIDPDCPEHLTEKPAKVLVIGDGTNRLTDLYRESMQEWARGRISLFYSGVSYVDHVMEGVSKGSAVQRLCRLLKISPENSVAAGDAENDISMLKAAHIGVAVANADDCVKEAADYITVRDCEHSAAAEIIHRFLLN